MSPAQATAQRARNTRGQGNRLRAELVDAAAGLLSTLDQPEALTLRQVARAAGVAPASVYDHFPDLGALLESVLEQRYAELAALMNEADREAGPIDRLVARCRIYLEWGDTHPADYQTLFSGRVPVGVAVGEVAHRSGTELLGALTAALTAVTDADGTASDADHAWAGLLLWTALHGLVSARAEHPNLPWPPEDRTILDLLALHTRLPAGRIAALLAAPRPTAAHPQGEAVNSGS